MLTSQVCTYESIHSPELRRWSDQLRPIWDADGTETRDVDHHHTRWEWLFICEALRESGMLQPGRRGLGFGVGREVLVSVFAGMGCHLVATDLGAEQAREAGWTENDQYGGGLAGLNDHGFCPPEEFQERVQYRDLDMNAIPDDLRDFDFTWSSGALEHVDVPPSSDTRLPTELGQYATTSIALVIKKDAGPGAWRLRAKHLLARQR